MEFVNNATSVKILSYRVWPLQLNPPIVPDFQIGDFQKCKFIVDDSYSAGIPFREHVFLSKVIGNVSTYLPDKGINFEQCEFSLQQKSPNLTNRGILAMGSRFNVEGSSFSGFAKGIEVRSLFLSQAYFVRRSVFERCAIGVHNVNNTGATIEGNIFYVGNMPSVYTGIFTSTPGFDYRPSKAVGVFFEGATNGFRLFRNKFYGSQFVNKIYVWAFGSYFKDLEASSKNIVVRNIYRGLAFGNYAEKYNGNKAGGLTYICNDNINLVHSRDFTAIDNSPVSGHLSMRLDQGLDDGFSSLAPALNKFSYGVGKDFFVLGETTYNYYVPNEPPSYPFFPHVFNGLELKVSKGVNNVCETEFKRFTDESRLTDDEREINLTNYFVNKTAYGQVKDSFESAVSEDEKEESRREMSFYKQEMDAAAYIGFINAPLDTTSHDSLRVWMQRFVNPAGDYMLAGDYIMTHEYSDAINTLMDIPNKYEFTDSEMDEHAIMEDIFNLVMKANGGSFSENAVQSLEEYADIDNGQAKYLAQSILTNNGYFFMPSITDVELPEGSENDGEVNSPKLLISPNPVGFSAIFDWSGFDVAEKEVTIEITNQAGGLVQVLHPDALAGMEEWTTGLVNDGIFYYRLLIDGVLADSGFFVVNK
ncbi:MAG TPA: hypothetical protein ENK85_10040 [Saprospiraceae bacterium]|nr:hypothetical protein [Saprospiraceae bacterium]